MALQDFRFYGKDTIDDSSDGGVRKIAYDIAQGNGAATSTNGGYAMLGQSQQHSLLANAITTCGDYCRAWNFSSGRYSANNYDIGWGGMAFVGTQSLGTRTDPADGHMFSAKAHYANTTGKRTVAAAVSIRATLRLGAENVGTADSGSYGSFIGIFAGARVISNTVQFSTNRGDQQDETMYDYSVNGTIPRGYSLLLSSRKHRSWGNSDIDNGDGTLVTDECGQEGVRLLLHLAGNTDTANASSRALRAIVHPCSGSYTFNNWYRVRMDITPLPGTDKIQVYTAAASDTVGSETWTNVKTTYVFAGQEQFWVKTHTANTKGMGYTVSAHRQLNATATDKNHDCYIDGLQILSKNI
jgi:hypothetical protein